MSLTPAEVKKLVFTWFYKITDHAPLDEMLAMLHPEKLEMTFPEATLRSRDDFAGWYREVTGKFFDQVHDLKTLDVEVSGNEARVQLTVNWQARTWSPPAPFSEREGVYAHQKWTVVKEDGREAPVITSYEVLGFDRMNGLLKS